MNLSARARLQGVSFVDAEDAGIPVPSDLVYTEHAIKPDEDATPALTRGPWFPEWQSGREMDDNAGSSPYPLHFWIEFTGFYTATSLRATYPPDPVSSPSIPLVRTFCLGQRVPRDMRDYDSLPSFFVFWRTSRMPRKTISTGVPGVDCSWLLSLLLLVANGDGANDCWFLVDSRSFSDDVELSR